VRTLIIGGAVPVALFVSIMRSTLVAHRSNKRRAKEYAAQEYNETLRAIIHRASTKTRLP
jgi:hypothetical protein